MALQFLNMARMTDSQKQSLTLDAEVIPRSHVGTAR